VFKLHFSLNHI